MNASRLLEHLSRIIDTPGGMLQLRRFVLDLVVRGRLVQQVASEVSALQRSGPREVSTGASIEFEIPQTWRLVTVADVAICRLGKMLDKGKNKGTLRRYLRNTNVRWFDFDLSDAYQMRFEDSELAEFALHSGDVLVCEGGEPGRCAVWDEREADIYFQKAIHRIRFSPAVDPHFFTLVLRQSADSGRLASYFTGVGIKHLTGRGLASYLFGVPPLGEQRRIVAKFDELMALCDRLDEGQAQCAQFRKQLLEALLHAALA